MSYGARVCGLISLSVAAVGFAAAQNPGIQFSGTIENYYLSNINMRGAQDRMTWMQLIADVNPHWRLVATNQQRINSNALDETFSEYSDKGTTIKGGVMRSAFGFSDWSELWYSGIINFPMVKGGYGSSDFRFVRLDTGLQISGGPPNFQYQSGLVDTNRKPRQLLPQHMDRGVKVPNFQRAIHDRP